MIAAFRRPRDSIFVTMTPAERFGVLLLLGLIWVAVLFAHLGQGDPTLVPVSLAFSGYILALSLPFIMPGFKPGIFHPLVFYILWVGLRGLLTGEAALAAGGLSTHFAPAAAQTDLNRALAMSFALETVAVLCIHAGYAFAFRARHPKLKTFEATGLAWKSLFWVGVSSIGVLAMFQHAGSFEVLLFQRGIRGEERITGQIGAHWVVLAQTATVVPLVWLACNSRAYRQLRFWAVVAFGLIVNFVMTGSRGGTEGYLGTDMGRPRSCCHLCVNCDLVLASNNRDLTKPEDEDAMRKET